MRLRSNHVLEPVAEWEQTRRRHVRASSAQSESESEPQPEPQPARRRRGARSVSTQPETQQESQPATRRRNTRGSSAQPEAQPEPQQPASRRRTTRGSSAQPEARQDLQPARRRNTRGASAQPEPQREPQPATRRRNTRGSSAQPEPQPEPQPATRRRRNTRGSSAQPESQSEPNEQVLSTPARQARRGRAANKDKSDLVTNLLEIEPTETTLAVMTSEDPEMRHGNRKRTRTTEDETPAKRYKPAPVITPGGSLIRARGSSRTTYADRTRRRQAEIGGRIHSTMFRVPEYLAQRDADARSASLPQDNDTHEQTPTPEESALPRETPVPATPIRANTPGWGRWVFDSVSRRWTGILGRPNVPQAADASHPAEREQQHTQAETSQQHGHSSLTAVSSSVPAGTSTTSPVRGSPAPVASARTDSHQAPTVPPRRRYNNYDLFSAGYSEEQRARWLINVPPAPTAPATTAIDSSTTQSAPQSSRAAQPETPTASKRKRQPTPDKIPNPPGCSYGLHDDYFIYDDEDWEANEKYNEQHPKITPTRAGASEDPDTEKRSSKRVRIKSPANSNQATSPRKMGSRRSRAERPANFNWSGHFEVPYSSSESSSSTRTSPASQSQTPGPFPSSPGPFPSSPAATPRVNASRRERVERPGPSEAPYSSPENSGSIASSPLDLPAPNTRSYHTTVESVEDDHSSFRDESPKTIGGAEPPKAEKDLGPLQKARDQAEQYKPKTPSRLRAAHRFSSSNTSYATSRSPFVRELEYVSTEAVRRRMMRETSLAKACPSGDMNQIRWPENDTWENRLRGGLTREVVAYNRRTQRHNLLSPAKLEEFDQRYHEALSRRRLENNYKPSLWSQRQLVK